MSQQSPLLQPLSARRTGALSGALRPPADRRAGLLALMFGALALGGTSIAGLPDDSEVLGLIDGLTALGVRVASRDGVRHVHGLGALGFLEPRGPIVLAGPLSAALLIGAVAQYGFTTRFEAAPSLSGVPFTVLLDALAAIGTTIARENGDRLPFTVTGPCATLPIAARIEANQPDAKAALLLAGLVVPGTSIVTEPWSSFDHAERLLRAFGAQVEIARGPDGARIVRILGLPDLVAQTLTVAGDPAIAGAAAAAALIVPGSAITLSGVMMNPTRIGLLETLAEMGGDIEETDRRRSGGEDLGDLTVRHARLTGIAVPAERAALMGTEIAALAVAAAFAEGVTTLSGMAALRATRPEFLPALVEGLRTNGVEVTESIDTLTIAGRRKVRGGASVRTLSDPMLALSFLVMGLAADKPVSIDDSSTIDQRYPMLTGALMGLGARLERSGR